MDHPPVRSSRVLGAALIGVAACAGLLAAPVAASTPDTGLQLPDVLGELVATDAVDAYPPDAAPPADAIERFRTANEFNADGFAAALGVDAAARRYSPGGELFQFYDVLAVATELSPLLPPSFVDPTVLQLEKPRYELVVVDDVNCVVTWATIADGDDVTAEDRLSSVCQAARGGLTVQVSTLGQDPPQDVAALVDLVFEAIA